MTDAVTGITLVSPSPQSPADGAQVKFTDQPLVLTTKNAVTTGKTALTYTFQVASDAAFASMVFSQGGVAQGSGTTSLTISKLAGAKSYYWRAMATSGSTNSLPSRARGFTVGPEIVIQAPTPLSPQNNANANGSSPTLTTSNATRTGPAGDITYLFEVADSSAFTNIVYTGTAAENSSGQTSLTVPTTIKLAANAIYYWRVTATDKVNNVSSAPSSVFTFKFVPFDMRQAVIHNSPPDLGFWDVSAHVTSVHFTDSEFDVDFDRRDGPNRWIDLDFGDGGGGSLQYTLGMCVNLSGTWHCSAVVQFWYGRDLGASAPPWSVYETWFYDPARWGPMAGYQPQDGESVGIFVGHGNLRGKSYTGADCPQICDRSDVAFTTWYNEGDTLETFGSALKTLGLKPTARRSGR
ncbi:MAG TPA: hypothetical protein VEU08_15210 [Vicinamibacterales bacterium]|nr:hypothetical protein [Vicinamibacterales bacterium]